MSVLKPSEIAKALVGRTMKYYSSLDFEVKYTRINTLEFHGNIVRFYCDDTVGFSVKLSIARQLANRGWIRLTGWDDHYERYELAEQELPI